MSQEAMARCTDCYYLRKKPPHVGCYAGEGESWVKWIPRCDVGLVRTCVDFQPRPDSEVPLHTDSVVHLMEMQKVIMEKVPGGPIPEAMAHQITCGMGIIEETMEYLNSIGRKPWRPEPLPLEKQLEELADILHFYLELILRSPFSWADVVAAYPKKHAENLKRYMKGSKGDYSWDDRATKEEL